MGSIDDLTHSIRSPAGDPEGALVLIHGRASDEGDLAPLLEQLDPDRRFVGVMPRGPLELPPGGFHWYAVKDVGFPDPNTFRPSYERLAGWFDALPEALDVPAERVVLGGFSQGAAMTYALAFAEGRARPAGVIALSGFMPVVEGFRLDLDGLEGYPIAIGHGTFDPILEAGFGRRARERFEEAGAEVTWREGPVQHTLDEEFLPELRGFVERVLGL